MKACLYLAVSMLLFADAGCGLEGPVPSESKPAPASQQAAQQGGGKPSAAATPSATGVAAVQPTAPAKPSATGVAATQPTAPATPSATGVAAVQPAAPARSSATGVAAHDSTPGMVREKAHVGMGVKGHGYGGGYLAVVAASYWSTKERLGLMQIQHDMDLFKANNDGKGPKTHEEFMQKIIKEGAIKLPQLPPGEKYLYDPATETLMVLKPADPNGP